MRRAPLLVVVGLCLLTAAFLLPVADFYTADWDRDFAYRTSGGGWCGDAVDEFRETGTTDADRFVVDAAELTETERSNVRRAVEAGEYVVETEGDVGGDTFWFPSDHVARGTGCYAVRDLPGVDRDVVALETTAVNHRTDTLQRTVASVGARAATVGGVLSLLAGTVLALRRYVGGS